MKPETLKAYDKYMAGRHAVYHKRYRDRNRERLNLKSLINYHIKKERALIAAGINGTLLLNKLLEIKEKII